jgi:protein ImuB
MTKMTRAAAVKQGTLEWALQTIEHWGLRTLGDLAGLPADELVARLGQQGLLWQAIARGEDVRPLVPTQPEERFESALDLEWPIDTLEPLAFVLTRLLEPLSIRLERRDRGAAALQIALRLTTREIHRRRLQLPSPVRDVRTLRGLALLDLESHPPPAAIDGVTVTIEPTPGRVLQHTLFARPHPTPEQLSTLLARLAALMGEDRIGTAGSVDSYQPGAFEMKPFATEHSPEGESLRSSPRVSLVSALRRCRQPVPVRVTVGAGNRPTHVAANRRGYIGGAVVGCAGPWRTSGCWWLTRGRESTLEPEAPRSAASEWGWGPARRRERESPLEPEAQRTLAYWNRDEWDVALSDGAVYRIFRDCSTDAWFIDAIVD